MSTSVTVTPAAGAQASAVTETRLVQRVLIAVALVFLAAFLLLPLAAVFTEALRNGFGTYLEALTDEDALAAIRLTLIAAGISVPANLVFGIAAACSI